MSSEKRNSKDQSYLGFELIEMEDYYENTFLRYKNL